MLMSSSFGAEQAAPCSADFKRFSSESAWAGVEYRKITGEGLVINLKAQRKYLLKGKNIITTQDWGANENLTAQFEGLVDETHVIGSCAESGLIVDAIRDGAVVGRAI